MRKDKWVGVRLTERQCADVDRLADAFNYDRSQMLRRLLELGMSEIESQQRAAGNPLVRASAELLLAMSEPDYRDRVREALDALDRARARDARIGPMFEPSAA